MRTNFSLQRLNSPLACAFCPMQLQGDVDLEAKLDEWERFYNFARPHGTHNGQTLYEALRDKLQ